MEYLFLLNFHCQARRRATFDSRQRRFQFCTTLASMAQQILLLGVHTGSNFSHFFLFWQLCIKLNESLPVPITALWAGSFQLLLHLALTC